MHPAKNYIGPIVARRMPPPPPPPPAQARPKDSSLTYGELRRIVLEQLG